jgi:hypothetical protein
MYLKDFASTYRRTRDGMSYHIIRLSRSCTGLFRGAVCRLPFSAVSINIVSRMRSSVDRNNTVIIYLIHRLNM